jgi:hypothetical protein
MFQISPLFRYYYVQPKMKRPVRKRTAVARTVAKVKPLIANMFAGLPYPYVEMGILWTYKQLCRGLNLLCPKTLYPKVQAFSMSAVFQKSMSLLIGFISAAIIGCHVEPQPVPPCSEHREYRPYVEESFRATETTDWWTLALVAGAMVLVAGLWLALDARRASDAYHRDRISWKRKPGVRRQPNK